MSKNKFKKQKPNKGKKLKVQYKEELSPELQTPVFSLHLLNERYCISKCQRKEKADFADTLRKLGKMTWRELKQIGRHKLGYEKISRDSIRTSVPVNLKGDARFIAFRFSGKKPMVGYRDKNIFHIIWLDWNLSLYKHD